MSSAIANHWLRALLSSLCVALWLSSALLAVFVAEQNRSLRSWNSREAIAAYELNDYIETGVMQASLHLRSVCGYPACLPELLKVESRGILFILSGQVCG